MSLRIRRGTATERLDKQFDLGEIVWETTNSKVFVGNGTTPGGINIFSTSAGTGLLFDGSVNGGVLKTDDSHINSLSETNTFALLNNDTHSGISFAHTEDGVITATVFNTEVDQQTIIDVVTSLFAPESSTDIVYSYNEIAGLIESELNQTNINDYASTLFTNVNTVHHNISFQYDTENHVLNATVADQDIQDLAAGLLTNNELHDNITFSYADSQLSASVTGVILSATPQLGGNLDLNAHDITGNGNIDINGVCALTPQSASPMISAAGTIAFADGDTETGWNPLSSTSASSYPVYSDGENWVHLGNYPTTNVLFVDGTRTDNHIATGSLISPFYKLEDALTAASNSALNEFMPVYIVLLSSIVLNSENDFIATITQPNIFITSLINDVNNLPTIRGTINIAADLDNTTFSIANVRIDADNLSNAIVFTGTASQVATLKNVKITGAIINDAILADNSGVDSRINLNDCEFDVTADNIISGTSTTFMYIDRCFFTNQQADSTGISIGATTYLRILNSIMNIPTGTGKAISGSLGSSVDYQGMIFLGNTNQNISSDIETIQFNSTFTPI